MKKILKTGTAIVTAICMVAGLSAVIGNGNSVEAAEGYTNWTYETVGLTGSKTQVAAGGQSYSGGDLALDGSQFNGYVKFSGAGTVSVQLTNGGYVAPLMTLGCVEGKDFWECNAKLIKFGLRQYTDSKYYLSCGVGSSDWWFMDQDFALNEDIFLQVTFDYVAKDSDNVKNDLVMTVKANGVAFNDLIVQHDGWNSGTISDLYVKDYVDATAPMRAYASLWGDMGSGTGGVSVRSAYGLNVKGIANNKTYCGGVTVTVATKAADGLLAKDLGSVTVGGTAVTLTDGQYAIPAGTGSVAVVVTDKVGNVQTYNITVNADHTWGAELVSNNDATCKEDGTKSKKCTVCQTVDTVKVPDAGSKLNHVFETYVSDNDATCVANGHETAECKFGCGEKDQREAANSATGNHTYGTDNKCTVCQADKPVEPPKNETQTGGTTTGASSVDTGDHNSFGLIMMFMAVSLATIAVVLRRRRMEQ